MKLALDLEKSLLKAVIEGFAPCTVMSPEEVSKEGRAILKSVRYLQDNGATTPIPPVNVFLAATNSFGADKDSLRDYLKSFKNLKLGKDAAALARACRHKELLVSLMNVAAKQLSDGTFDVQELFHLMNQSEGINETLEPIASILPHYSSPPVGNPIISFPTIDACTHGLQGIWVLGGDPGIGKSTLAWQLMIDSKLPAIYYDLDGTGLAWMIDRTKAIFPNTDLTGILQNVHYQDTIRTLDANLMAVKPPALLIIDSVQTLPTNILHRRTSLDKWIVTFKEIAKRGYTFILISELNRSSYGEAQMGGYKETGELEYAGSVCAHLVGEDPDYPLKFYIKKNRHGTKNGLIAQLERDQQRKFWFNEI